jgi:hypothetical protein
MAGLTLETYPSDAIAPPLHAGANSRRHPVAISGADPKALLDVRRSEVNLAVWDRTLPTMLGPALRLLTEEAPFTVVVEDTPQAAVDSLAAKLPAAAPLDLLLDIRRLALLFAAVIDTGRVLRIRLEAITGPACHRWHADAVGLRLLCTYRGPGTEWLPLAGGARAARDLDPKALPCESGRIATGAVAILKGEGFAGNAGFGCIHRSPPASPGERARLLLCIDEPGRIPLE